MGPSRRCSPTGRTTRDAPHSKFGDDLRNSAISHRSTRLFGRRTSRGYLATDSSRNLAPARDAVDRIDARPDAVGLIYPVIAMVPPFAHPLSTRRLLGDAPTPDAITLHSPASRVTATTPPLFLVHALDDGVVPSDNSLLMMASMRRAGHPLEVHLYGEGGHGFGLGASSSPVNAWAQSFDVWLQRTFSMALITSIPSRA